jgi:hypothetical protein
MTWTVYLDIRLIAEVKTWPLVQQQQLRAAQRLLREGGASIFGARPGKGERTVVARFPAGIFTLHLDIQTADTLILRWASYFPNPVWQ